MKKKCWPWWYAFEINSGSDHLEQEHCVYGNHSSLNYLFAKKSPRRDCSSGFLLLSRGIAIVKGMSFPAKVTSFSWDRPMKLLIFSKLAIVDLRRDIIVPTTPLKKISQRHGKISPLTFSQRDEKPQNSIQVYKSLRVGDRISLGPFQSSRGNKDIMWRFVRGDSLTVCGRGCWDIGVRVTKGGDKVWGAKGLGGLRGNRAFFGGGGGGWAVVGQWGLGGEVVLGGGSLGGLRMYGCLEACWYHSVGLDERAVVMVVAFWLLWLVWVLAVGERGDLSVVGGWFRRVGRCERERRGGVWVWEYLWVVVGSVVELAILGAGLDGLLGFTWWQYLMCGALSLFRWGSGCKVVAVGGCRASKVVSVVCGYQCWRRMGSLGGAGGEGVILLDCCGGSERVGALG
ncbi:hypothetical protein Tco_0814087 [Tanacetum coccineum]